jgi:hypothetical protein
MNVKVEKSASGKMYMMLDDIDYMSILRSAIVNIEFSKGARRGVSSKNYRVRKKVARKYLNFILRNAMELELKDYGVI